MMIRSGMVVLPGGFCLVTGFAIAGCTFQPAPSLESSPESPTAASPATEASKDDLAVVTAVEATPRDDNSYTFAVSVQSPDTGCEQYANWWEVLTEEGDLLYRRILAHSHVDEQPFTRTGGPVPVTPTETVIVRAHMHPQGYGPQAMLGDATNGFEKTELPENFAADLTNAEPQPGDCAF